MTIKLCYREENCLAIPVNGTYFPHMLGITEHADPHLGGRDAGLPCMWISSWQTLGAVGVGEHHLVNRLALVNQLLLRDVDALLGASRSCRHW